jgi:hypothetical protein
MKKAPFTLEVTSQAARFTFYRPVAGADYCEPTQSFAIPLGAFRAICASPPKPGEVSYFLFTTPQLRAHGVQTQKP